MNKEIEAGTGDTGVEQSLVESGNSYEGSYVLKEVRLALKEIELGLKRQELHAAASPGREPDKKFISSPLSIAIITGIIGLIAAAVASLLQSNASLTLEQKKFEFASEQEAQKNKAINELERQKFESTLVLKAIETGNPAVAARNLQFLIDANYLHDAGGQIAKYIKEPEAGKGPVLPRPGASILPQADRNSSVTVAKDPFGNRVQFQTSPDRTVKFLGDWEKQNIVTVSVPQLRGIKNFPASGNVRFNKNAAEALKAAWAEIAEKNLIDRVQSWDGGYHPRVVVGSSAKLSSHAYGIAFDINASYNPGFKTPPAIGEIGSVRELVPIFEKYGFSWGGNSRVPDGNHFQYKFAVPQ